ncbi:unnamed protein product [Effrenium voratum]|nr:unnamed protein product [Effrenium voratum]
MASCCGSLIATSALFAATMWRSWTACSTTAQTQFAMAQMKTSMVTRPSRNSAVIAHHPASGLSCTPPSQRMGRISEWPTSCSSVKGHASVDRARHG